MTTSPSSCRSGTRLVSSYSLIFHICFFWLNVVYQVNYFGLLEDLVFGDGIKTCKLHRKGLMFPLLPNNLVHLLPIQHLFVIRFAHVASVSLEFMYIPRNSMILSSLTVMQHCNKQYVTFIINSCLIQKCHNEFYDVFLLDGLDCSVVW